MRFSADVFGGFSHVPRVKLAGAIEVFRSVYISGGVDDVFATPGYLPIETGNAAEPTYFNKLRYGRDYFLGGEIGLDVEGARRAIEERCAKPLGLDVTEAANGIVEIANAAMVNALHLISVQRGYDPRDFALVAFGGAGALHGAALAKEQEEAFLYRAMQSDIVSQVLRRLASVRLL